MKRFLQVACLALVIVIGFPALASNEPAGVMASTPSPSPDGRRVVFSADFGSPTSPQRLWVANGDGTGLRLLQTALGSKGDESPAWSPSGEIIAFSSFDGQANNIWTVRADGTLLTQLTSNALNNRQPAWSPDGRRIAFVSDRGGSNDIWIMNVDGTGQTRLTTLPGEENHPSFSPDGTNVVFSETSGDLANLMVVKASGGAAKNLTNRIANDWNPSWGPGGVVFASNRDSSSEHWKLWVVQGDGSGLGKLGDVIAIDPAWSRDGTVLFADELSPIGALAAITAYAPSTGTKRVIVNQSGFQALVGVRPFAFGMVPNVNPTSNGKLRISILSSASFDATKLVDRTSITSGRTGKERSLWKCYDERFDVNRDGIADLVCKIRISLLGLTAGDAQLIIRFNDTSGVPFQGNATITTVGVDDPDDKTE